MKLRPLVCHSILGRDAAKQSFVRPTTGRSSGVCGPPIILYCIQLLGSITNPAAPDSEQPKNSRHARGSEQTAYQMCLEKLGPIPKTHCKY